MLIDAKDHGSLSGLEFDNHSQYWADTTIGVRAKNYATTGTLASGTHTIGNDLVLANGSITAPVSDIISIGSMITADGSASLLTINGDTDILGKLSISKTNTVSGSYTTIQASLDLDHSGLVVGDQFGNIGQVFISNSNGATYSGNLIGIQGQTAIIDGAAGSYQNIIGVSAIVTGSTVSGSIEDIIGVDITGSAFTIAGSIGRLVGIDINNSATGPGSITDNIGICIGDITGATNNHAIKTGLGDVQIGGDLYWVGAGSGLPYGSLYIHEGASNVDISAVGQGVYVKITGLSTGETNLVTINSDAFNVDKVGVYEITWQVSGDSQGINKDYEIDIFVNGVEQVDGSARQQFGATGSLSCISGSAIIDVTDAGHDVDLRMKEIGAGAGTDFDIFNLNFSVKMLGGT